jgi:hypothetical protein
MLLPTQMLLERAYSWVQIRNANRYLKYRDSLTLAYKGFEITHTSSLHNAENISSPFTAGQKRSACSICCSTNQWSPSRNMPQGNREALERSLKRTRIIVMTMGSLRNGFSRYATATSFYLLLAGITWLTSVSKRWLPRRSSSIGSVLI